MERIPPQDIDAEQAVLGGILIDDSRIDDIIFLKPGDFYRQTHQLIYRSMQELANNNQPIDMLTVHNKLGKTESVGASYIAQLADITPTAANVEYYARIVKGKAQMRKVISVSNKAAAVAYQGEKDASQLVEDLTGELLGVLDADSNDLPDIMEQLVKVIPEIQDRKPGQINGIKTGLAQFDLWTNGLQDGDLVVIAARPSMGKSSLGLQVAAHAALADKLVVAVFSLEMTYKQCIERIVANQCAIDSTRMRQGQLQDDDYLKMNNLAAALSQSKLVLDDPARLSVSDLLSKCRKIKRKYGSLDLIVVDYMQKMTGKGENRNQEVSYISSGLKAIAKEFRCPVLALAQLSRRTEGRQNKRPEMADLRESGGIEQDADLVGFIYRDDYYNPESAKKGVAELIISKQRMGPTGTLELFWIKEYQRFVPIEKLNPPGGH